MKQQKKNKKTVGHDYNKIGSYAWAFRKLWKLDKVFVLLLIAGVPVAVVYPLAQSLFTRELIDAISQGKTFGELAAVCAGFTGAIVGLQLLQEFLDSKC